MGFPRLARNYLWIMGLVAIGCLDHWLVTLRTGPPPDTSRFIAMGLLLALGIASQHFPLPISPQNKIDLSMAVYFACLVLFGAPLGVELVAISQLVGQGTLALRRNPTTGRRLRTSRSAIFNASQLVVATTVAGIVIPYPLLGATPLAFAEAWRILVAALALFTVNTLAVATMVGLQRGENPLKGWWESQRLDTVEFTGLFLIGLATAFATVNNPWAPLVMALPAIALHRSLQRSIRLLEREQAARRQAEEASTAKVRAILEERARIAMDLHDGTIQSLYSVVLTLRARERAWRDPRNREKLASQWSFDDEVARVNSVIQDVRNYIFDLRAEECPSSNLVSGLRTIAKELEGNSTIRIDLQVDRLVDDDLAPDVVDNLVHVAREATTNVIRHANASRVQISLSQSCEALVLVIRDNGRGFSTTAGGCATGHGLQNMAERARSLGGHCSLETAPGCGAVVRVAIPMVGKESVSGDGNVPCETTPGRRPQDSPAWTARSVSDGTGG